MVHASERDRADVKAKRANWSKIKPTMQAASLVFLDESGVNTNLTRRYGRAKGKERVKDSAPLNTLKTTTILSSVRIDGTTVAKFFAGSMNDATFFLITYSVTLFRRYMPEIWLSWITVDFLLDALPRAFKAVSVTDIMGWFREAGYLLS